MDRRMHASRDGAQSPGRARDGTARRRKRCHGPPYEATLIRRRHLAQPPRLFHHAAHQGGPPTWEPRHHSLAHVRERRGRGRGKRRCFSMLRCLRSDASQSAQVRAEVGIGIIAGRVSGKMHRR